MSIGNKDVLAKNLKKYILKSGTTTLALAEPNLRVSKVVISVASMKGTTKANTGRPCFPKYV